jgi:porin
LTLANIARVVSAEVSLRRGCRQTIAALLTLAAAALAAHSGSAQTSTGAGTLWERDGLTGDWGGLRTGLADKGITFGLQQQSELWGNVTGGLRQGGTYNGLLTVSLAIDLRQAVGWQGANFFANGFQVQGIGPTPLLVGALQTISGLEAAPSVKLYDLWLEQQLFGGTLSLRFGQEGANDEMMLSQYGLLFLNSSFGYPALLALDLPSGGPNYPLATPFVRISFQATGDVKLVGAVYTGDPAPPGTGNPQLRDLHGTAFRLNDHALSFGELWYSPHQLASIGLPATYKLGVWADTGRFADPQRGADGLSLASSASDGQPLLHAADHAVYAIIDQMVWKKPNTEAQGISLFMQVMHAPDDRNLSDLFVEGGLDWKGIIPGRSHDAAGLAVTHAGISAPAISFSHDLVFYTGTGRPYSPGETVIEATYRARLTPWLKVQPDLQLVVNPGAGIPTAQSATPLKNDLIFGVRVTVNF